MDSDATSRNPMPESTNLNGPVIDASAKAPALEATLPAPADLAGLEPLRRIEKRWPLILGGLLSIATLAMVVYELLHSGLRGLSQIVPATPWFYVAFFFFYMIPPTFDYFIFRRLWHIPLSGMVALHKKRIANEVLIGYSGEAYFYAWARQRTQMVAAPFGAVKDVTILSAMAGHAVTLTGLAIALGFGIDLLTPQYQRTLLVSVGVIIAMTLPFLIFSRRVFSLPRAQLWWIFGMHCLRIVLGSVSLAFAWYFALPDVPVMMWLFLVAGRLLVSRLPLVPNKELLFASFAIMLIGQGETVTQLLAFTAALTLLVHAVLIGCFSIYPLVRRNG